MDNRKEILNILNNLRDIAKSNDDSVVFNLSKIDAEILFKYLMALKEGYDKNKRLLDELTIKLEQNRVN